MPPETTIEQQLQKTIEDQQKKNADLQKENADLKATAEALEQVNGDLTAKIEELSKAVPSELATEKKPEVPAGAFQVGKKSFKFITPVFLFGGNRIVAEEAIHDKALLESLVKKGCGVIQEL